MISKPKYLTQDLALILYLIKKAKIKKKKAELQLSVCGKHLISKNGIYICMSIVCTRRTKDWLSILDG